MTILAEDKSKIPSTNNSMRDISPSDELTREPVEPTMALLLRNPITFLAFGFGSGLAPKAPGTAGTLAAIPLFLLMAQMEFYTYIGVVLLAFFAGIYICEKASRVLGVHDHGGIVWDEFVGLWITMIAVPLTWYWLVLGFVLFRVFDMLKPWPISVVDRRVHGGFGIMIDDVLAGIAAWLCLQGIIWVV